MPSPLQKENNRIITGLYELARAMRLQETKDKEYFQASLRDEPLGYCPTCQSCGEPGCCPPTSCQTVICHYGKSNLKDYKELLREWDVLYGHMEALFGKEAVAALLETVEGK